MSAQLWLNIAVRAALIAHRPLADALTGVFDAPPPRALTPYARVEEALLADWGVKGIEGREGRIGVTLLDAGESPVRLRRLSGELEAAMAQMPRDIGGGWDLVHCQLVRARIEPRGAAADRWIASSEWRVRLLKTEN